MMQANHLTANPLDIRIRQIQEDLPRLPKVIRYYDDFDDKIRSIEKFQEKNEFDLHCSGKQVRINFSRFNPGIRDIIKAFFFHLIASELKAFTAYGYVVALNSIANNLLTELITSEPRDIKETWRKIFAVHCESVGIFLSARSLLSFIAQYNVGEWSRRHIDFIRDALPSPAVDKYASIRSGDVFLSAADEALIVKHIESINELVNTDSKQVSNATLNDTCMLACSYLFAMRPSQIARLEMRDYRHYCDDKETIETIHLTFKMVKQKSRLQLQPLTRKVRTRWVPLFLEMHQRSRDAGKCGSDRFFDVTSSYDVSSAIIKLASQIVGTTVTATDLRHTAAQRLVDAGANQEEVAEFMGHSDVRTCLVYYTSSPTQAELVNRALCISPIYQKVAQIAHDKFISEHELSQLKGTQQIGGVPHGIPISGIGGCASGQPSCPYNPITACYGCSKFMPVANLNTHKKVLEDLRCVVLLFEKSSRGESNTPAFLQLHSTLRDVQTVIEELEVSNA